MAPEAYSASFVSHFALLKDPRRTTKGNLIYPLNEILFLVMSSVLCGHSDYICIEDFGEQNLEWLRKYFPYSNGTCSHDVIGRLFQKIDYDCFSQCFSNWAKQTYHLTEAELIAIDGKRIRGSYDSNKLATHIVSAYLSSSNITIGQVATEEKSNEITAIPELLDKIDIQGAVVSIDAMGCQKEIAEKIISKKADYLLAVKDNQKDLHSQLKRMFTLKLSTTSHTSKDFDHGRIEKRTCKVIDDTSWVCRMGQWEGLSSLVMIETERIIKNTGQMEKQTRYYISSLLADAALISNAIRSHWGIENKLHWTLDVVFQEDKSRKRAGYAAENFSTVTKIVLNILKQKNDHKGAKRLSVKTKRFKCNISTDYLTDVLKNL